jgi:transposase-like protein
MSEHDTPDAVTKVARDLSEILALSEALEDQAVEKANDRLMPGGLSMVALGGVASPEAWENVYEAAEALSRPTEHVADHDDDWEPPLQTILFWSEILRVEHNRESDRRPTIASEVAFIRAALNWLWENEPHFEDFARDVNRARVRLEELLYAGNRVERTRVPCNNPGCERRPRLIKLYGERATEDRYKCPGCKKRYDQGDYEDAYAEQLRSEGARRFVKKVDAVSTLKAQGRSEYTVRNWFEACLVTAYCDLRTRQVFAWWPEIWHLHTITRKRGGRAA